MTHFSALAPGDFFRRVLLDTFASDTVLQKVDEEEARRACEPGCPEFALRPWTRVYRFEPDYSI